MHLSTLLCISAVLNLAVVLLVNEDIYLLLITCLISVSSSYLVHVYAISH